MNDNTVLRIKVPAHLYESVKKQLTITEAKKSGKAFGDWTVVKEKKLPKDGMKKVEEVNQIEEIDKEMEKKTRTLDELKKAKAQIDKKIEEMSKSEEPMNEDANELLMQLANTITDPDIINAIGRKLNMNANELLNFFAGGTTIGTLGALLKQAANKDKKRAQQGN